MFILIHAVQQSDLAIGLHTYRMSTRDECLQHIHQTLLDEVLEEEEEIVLEDLTEDDQSFYYGLTDIEDQIKALIEYLEEMRDSSHKYVIEEI